MDRCHATTSGRRWLAAARRKVPRVAQRVDGREVDHDRAGQFSEWGVVHRVEHARGVPHRKAAVGHLLKAGDWMFIPANVPYSISASKNPGMGVCYMYG